jgi:hypothetical protein
MKNIAFDWNLMKETKLINIHVINKWNKKKIKKISINNLNYIDLYGLKNCFLSPIVIHVLS